MPKPVCVPCKQEFKVKKNGVIVQENLSPSGNPYKIWSADLWECPKCHTQILSGYGLSPMAHQFNKDFDKLQENVEIIFY